MSVLRNILAHKRAELGQRAAQVSLAQIRRRALAAAAPRGFAKALSGPGLAVIAELKRASPSAGRIADLDPSAVAAN